MKSCDVIVVGGGLSGAATMFNLSKLGYKVILFERGNIASGASGRNGGQVIQLDGRDRDREAIMKRLHYSKKTIMLLKEYQKELDVDFEFRQVGSLDIAASEAELDELKELCEMQINAGDDEVEFLDWKGLHEVSPHLGDFLTGARFRWTDGNLYPFNLTNGLIAESRKYGAEIYTGCEVEKVAVESGRVKGIELKNRKFFSDMVVLATSAWTKNLFPELKIIPLRSHAALSDIVPEIRAPAFEVVIEEEIIYGSTQFKNGHMLVGGGPDRPRTMEEQYDYKLSWKDTLKNASILAMLFPELGDTNILRCWAGTMGTTPDGLPLVGRSGIADGLYVIGGFPNGMAFIPYIAKLLSDLIANRPLETDLEMFDPDRFKDLFIKLPERYNYTILADCLGRL
ncbi:MAG: FAD-binding oxidoreductase [Spirochaetes bacterium]|nr:FAD-binding oxidoreductase [Spirochaetota bacterium]